ncbi:MAG TPA: ribokinase [Clostridiaceae bacterium]|nr:ribokinase [Clostridiaceae bacterium]
MKKRIMVFGSFVVDLMGRGPHLPVPGETVKGTFFKMGPGGKGFNQGVAAHKAGGDVTMITKLGKDTFANIAVDAMKELNMDTSHLLWSEEHGTGVALIEVDDTTGQNAIMVIPSACNDIFDEEVDNLEGILDDSDYLLTQLETNMSSIEKIVDMAYRKNKIIIMNTAPFQPVEDELLRKINIVTPNEVEAELLTGVKVVDQTSASEAADHFFQKGVKSVVITMGGKGAFVSDGNKEMIIPPFKVEVLDTTGAGDAFNGGFVAALAEGKDIFEASIFASAVAALSVQKMGTTPSMPTREEVDAFLEQQNK